MASLKFKPLKTYEPKGTKELAVLFPYKEFSKGGRALAAGLDVPFIRMSRGVPISNETPLVVINWGDAGGNIRMLTRGFNIARVFNSYQKVSLASDKLHAFTVWDKKISIPEFTTSFSEAMEWVEDGQTVLGRRRRGSCGKDIKFIDEDLEGFANSEFWVKYKKKKDEFRVHVAFGRVIDVQRKALRQTDHEGNPIDTTKIDFRIRNLAHGFIFKRNDISVPSCVTDEAVKAVSALDLDFGAVDVIFNEAEGRAYILEVNTAPGLEGSTVDSYINAFRDELARTLTAADCSPAVAGKDQA